MAKTAQGSAYRVSASDLGYEVGTLPEGLPRAVPANASRQTRTPPAQLVEALGGGPKWGAQHMGVLENFAGNILCAECTALIDPAATHHPFGVWDYSTQGFVTKPGRYTIYVGNSADNTPHTATLTAG